MLRSSRSEFGAADLVPPEVAHAMRVTLRQMRFGQPQEYAQMEQNEVRKFLSSKSVHNWLSEWNLSHTFSMSNRENTSDRRSRKVDFCAQCTGEEIDSALGLRSAAVPSVPSAAPLPSSSSDPFAPFGNASALPWHNSFAMARNFPSNFSSRPHIFHPHSLMNASTNTQTTETTRTSGGTGGRMHVFRRASLLEEYAQKTLQRLEEKEEERMNGTKGMSRKGKDGRRRRGGRGRRRRKGCRWWTSKCCGGRGTESSGDDDKEDSSFSSEAMANEKKAENIVKRFTLSSNTNWGEEKEREKGDKMTGNGKKWRRKTKGWGDYDNVPEGWRKTDERWEEEQWEEEQPMGREKDKEGATNNHLTPAEF